MATALTGSLGWSGLHPLQCGGPPLISSYEQSLPDQALSLIAHVYQSDGVTALGTISVLARPTIHLTLANGGPDSITLEVASRNPIPTYGQVIYGQAVYGAQVTHGNVIRLSEQGGDGRFIYAGIVESLPDTISPDGVSHGILLTPFAMEAGRAYVQLNYTADTDVAQMVRDAISATQHCHCDQVSVPPSTGLVGMGDFRNRTAQEVLDTARAIAGYQWFWHIDVAGRCWFQPMGSTANYTLKLGRDYENRTSNGGDIASRINDVLAVGGVPDGASDTATARYTGTSQATLGVRSLNPPLQLQNITDLTTLQNVVASVGTVMDRTWLRVSLKALPTIGSRIHASRPGGAMLRYWEPVVSPMDESEAGSGGYTGPFIVQSVESDGLAQTIAAGDVPVTDQRDIDTLVARLVGRAAANAVVNAPASLNQPTVLGSTGTQINPLASLGYSVQTPGQNITSTSFTALSPSIAVPFTLTRTIHCLILFRLRGKTTGGGGTFAYVRANVLDSNSLAVATSPSREVDVANTGKTEVQGWMFTGNTAYASIGPGTYTARVEVSVDAGQTCAVDTGELEVWQCGT